MLNSLRLFKILSLETLRSTLDKQGKRKHGKFDFYALFVVLILIYTGITLISLSTDVVNFLVSYHQPSIFLAVIVILNFFICFTSSLVGCSSIFYFSKDNEFIATTIMKPREIMWGKSFVILARSYMIVLMFGIIPLVTYGVITMQGFGFYLATIMHLLISPLAPTYLAMVLTVFVCGLMPRIKKQQWLSNLAIVLIMVVVFAGTFAIVSMSEYSTQELIRMLLKADRLINLIKGYFPFLKYNIELLSEVGLRRLLAIGITILISAIILLLFNYLDKYYWKGLANSLNANNDLRISDSRSYRFKQQHVAITYIKKELKSILKRAESFQQTVLPFTLAMVLIAFIPLILRLSFGDVGLYYDEIIMFMGVDEAYFLHILNIFCLYLSGLCFMAITSISRDGNDAYFMKQIPIPFYQQIIYKASASFIIFSVVYGLGIIIFCISLRIPPLIWIANLLISLFYIFNHSLFFVLLDARKPKLHWLNLIEVYKKNFRTLWVFVISLGLTFIYAAMMAKTSFGSLDLMSIFAINLSIQIMLTLVLYYYIKRKNFSLAKNIN